MLSSIKANRILTGGSIKGSMVVNEVACFLDTSLIEGDVLTKKIIINNGAQFKGTIETHEQVTLNHDDKETSECFHLQFAENHKKVANYKLNIIGKSAVIDGELHCHERNLLCFGKINGKINAPNQVVFVASGAEVNGEINCKRLHVLGKVLGNVEVSGLTSCDVGSIMNAKVITKSFMLKEGASYEGQVCLGGVKDEVNQQCYDNQENKVQEDIKENGNDSVINND